MHSAVQSAACWDSPWESKRENQLGAQSTAKLQQTATVHFTLSYIKLQHSISQTPPEHEQSMTVNS